MPYIKPRRIDRAPRRGFAVQLGHAHIQEGQDLGKGLRGVDLLLGTTMPLAI